jgi:subtilase family serine protease
LIGLLITLSTFNFPAHAGSSDLTVDTIWLERASAPGVPVAGTDLTANESFNIVASIKNLGQEAANGYYLDVYYDNDYGRGGPDNIAAGEVQEWYVGPLTATAGTHVTQWVVDPDNQIAELDEQNNVKQNVFTVGSGEPQTTTGSTATVSVTVIQNSTSFSYGTTTTTTTTYTTTSTSTSTIPSATTVVLVPLTTTSTVQNTQYLTSILTTTVTSYTTTSTMTSTMLVYTTTTSLAGMDAPSPLAYIGFMSLLAFTVGWSVAHGKGLSIPKVRSLIGRRCSTS